MTEATRIIRKKHGSLGTVQVTARSADEATVMHRPSADETMIRHNSLTRRPASADPDTSSDSDPYGFDDEGDSGSVVYHGPRGREGSDASSDGEQDRFPWGPGGAATVEEPEPTKAERNALKMDLRQLRKRQKQLRAAIRELSKTFKLPPSLFPFREEFSPLKKVNKQTVAERTRKLEEAITRLNLTVKSLGDVKVKLEMAIRKRFPGKQFTIEFIQKEDGAMDGVNLRLVFHKDEKDKTDGQTQVYGKFMPGQKEFVLSAIQTFSLLERPEIGLFHIGLPTIGDTIPGPDEPLVYYSTGAADGITLQSFLLMTPANQTLFLARNKIDSGVLAQNLFRMVCMSEQLGLQDVRPPNVILHRDGRLSIIDPLLPYESRDRKDMFASVEPDRPEGFKLMLNSSQTYMDVSKLAENPLQYTYSLFRTHSTTFATRLPEEDYPEIIAAERERENVSPIPLFGNAVFKSPVDYMPHSVPQYNTMFSFMETHLGLSPVEILGQYIQYANTLETAILAEMVRNGYPLLAKEDREIELKRVRAMRTKSVEAMQQMSLPVPTGKISIPIFPVAKIGKESQPSPTELMMNAITSQMEPEIGQTIRDNVGALTQYLEAAKAEDGDLLTSRSKDVKLVFDLERTPPVQYLRISAATFGLKGFAIDIGPIGIDDNPELLIQNANMYTLPEMFREQELFGAKFSIAHLIYVHPASKEETVVPLAAGRDRIFDPSTIPGDFREKIALGPNVLEFERKMYEGYGLDDPILVATAAMTQ